MEKYKLTMLEQQLAHIQDQEQLRCFSMGKREKISMDDKYLKIIDLPYKKSKTHKQMSISDRASQFMSFSALEGYDKKIKEHSKLTSEKREISVDDIENIDKMLKELIDKQSSHPLIKIDFFDDKQQDNKSIVERVVKVDLQARRLVLADEREIDFNDIYCIQWYN